jgi:hypothetical protein
MAHERFVLMQEKGPPPGTDLSPYKTVMNIPGRDGGPLVTSGVLEYNTMVHKAVLLALDRASLAKGVPMSHRTIMQHLVPTSGYPTHLANPRCWYLMGEEMVPGLYDTQYYLVKADRLESAMTTYINLMEEMMNGDGSDNPDEEPWYHTDRDRLVGFEVRPDRVWY